jgi:hypothetical protein
MVYAAVGAFAMEVQSFLLAFAAALVVPALTMLIARRWNQEKSAKPATEERR